MKISVGRRGAAGYLVGFDGGPRGDHGGPGGRGGVAWFWWESESLTSGCVVAIIKCHMKHSGEALSATTKSCEDGNRKRSLCSRAA